LKINKKKKDAIYIIVALVLSFGVMVFISKMNNTNIFEEIKRIKIYDIIIAYLIYSLSYFVDSLRFKVVIKPFNTKVKFINLFYNNVIGYLLSAITPFAAGGQPFQIYHLHKSGLSSEASTNIIASRFLEMMFLNLGITIFSYKIVVNSVKGSVFSSKMINLGLIVSVVVSVFFLILFIKTQWIAKFIKFIESKNKISKLGKKLEGWTNQFNDSIKFLWSEKVIYMIADIFLGLVTLMIQSYSLYYMLSSYVVCDPVPFFFWKVFGGMTLLNMVVYYIPTPGASGSVEASYHILFTSFTGDSKGVLLAIFGWRFATYYLQIIFDAVFVFFYNVFHKEVI